MTPPPPPPGPQASKAEWRRWARTLPPVPAEVTTQVVDHLRDLLRGREGPVLAYLALPDEVAIESTGLLSRPVLPRLDGDGTMHLHVDDGLHEDHASGIRQPPAGAPEVKPEDLAVVLVPGRVFDRAGYRLGRGGGHYDRLLPRLAPGTPVIGITVEARIVDRLPREPHDRPMTHLVTELGPFSTK